MKIQKQRMMVDAIDKLFKINFRIGSVVIVGKTGDDIITTNESRKYVVYYCVKEPEGRITEVTNMFLE